MGLIEKFLLRLVESLNILRDSDEYSKFCVIYLCIYIITYTELYHLYYT